MRTLEQIEQELQEAREALTHVQGRSTEVYSRIVGYYRSVKNWNKGKREEYEERKLFRVPSEKEGSTKQLNKAESVQPRLILFVRAACPACPPAKDAATKLGIPVELVDADTAQGLSEAARLNVHATPTAIFLDTNGKELGRAKDARSILAFAKTQNQLETAV